MDTRTLFRLVVAVVTFAASMPAWGQFGGLGGLGGPDEKIVSVSARFAGPKGSEPGHVFVTAAISPGWHIYSVTQTGDGPRPTTIKIAPVEGVEIKGPFRPFTPPLTKRTPIFEGVTIEYHRGEVTWFARLEVAPGVDLQQLRLSGSVTAQACDDADTQCMPPESMPFIAVVGPAMEIPSAAKADTRAGSPPAFDPNALRVADTEETQQMSFLLVIGLAFLGGLILNLMPCVLPVIGLKVLSFVEQAGHSRTQALKLNAWYALGLLTVFWVLAGLAIVLGYGWGQLFTNKEFTIGLSAIVFIMGLSFLGVWEIPIPGFVGRGKFVEAAQHEGVAGAFSKGALTTVLATPCSAPFLGSAITWSVVQPPLVVLSVFTAIGVGMASPYLVVGVFPELLRFIPKPGAWMDTFKQVMGFVLLGTVAFLLTSVPLELVVPTVVFMFGLWAACWWIGRLSPTADGETTMRQWMGAVAFAGLIWVIAFPGLTPIYDGKFSFGGVADVMRNQLDHQIEQRLANATASAQPKKTDSKNMLPWQAFTRNSFEQHVAASQTVLVDFTANWCLTCKTLEATVLNTEAVRQKVDENAVITMKADWTHGDPQVTEMLQLLGAKQVPVIAIFPAGQPNVPIVFARGGYTQQAILDALGKAGPSVKPAETATAGLGR